MGGQADQRVRAEQPAGQPGRDVVLADMQHIDAGEGGEIGTVVGADQCSPPLRDIPHHSEPVGFGLPLQPLFAKLDDVHPAGEHFVEERGQGRPQAETQVQPGIGQPDQTRLRLR